MSYIEPKILKGTRDFLPEEMAKRQSVLGRIIEVFKLFGYDEIDTPAIEYAETLLGKYGDEGSKLVYSFLDNGGRKIALRYDQTVPFARVVAANYANLPMPFKRYQISKVWRADKPAKGRYREFTQCDIDIIGTKNLLAEAEVAKAVYTIFQKLGLNDVIIKVNSRRLINSVMNSVGVQAEKQTAVMRALDKLDKIGVEGVREELASVISPEILGKLISILLISGTNKEKLNKLNGYETKEIAEFLNLCESFGINEKNLLFEPSLARGLDYYTGIIYEAYIKNADVGAVCAGGRYDNLCGMFTDKDFSGVGVAFGFDRIVLAMEMNGLLSGVGLNSEALVTYFDNETLPDSLKILSLLQEVGIKAEIYFEPAKMDKQFKYAAKKKIPFVLIYGPDEAAADSVAIKNMSTGKQKTIPRSQLEMYFNGYTAI